MDAMGERIFPRTNLASGTKNRDLVDILRNNVTFTRKFPWDADAGQYDLHGPKSSIERKNGPQFSLEPSNIGLARGFTSFIAQPQMHDL